MLIFFLQAFFYVIVINMKLDSNIYLPRENKQISFNAKKTTLKDADWVCRSVNNNFPALSTTWLNFNLENNNGISAISKIGKTIQDLRNANNSELFTFNFVKNLLESVKKNSAGNCYEKATIAELILRMNGIKNCKRINLVADDGRKNLEHCVSMVNFDTENPYPNPQKVVIIDPWSGVSGYADYIFKVYTNMFNRYFKLGNDDQIQFVARYPLELTDEEIEYFKQRYPELVFKSHDKHKLMCNG